MRRALSIAVATVALLLAFAGVSAAETQVGIVRPTTEPSHASIQLGSQLFAANCSSCHGIAGSGIYPPRPGAGDTPGSGPPLRGVGAEAPDFYLQVGYMPLASIHQQPTPGRVLLTNKEIKSLVSYVASLGKGPGIPKPDPKAGSLNSGFGLFDLHCAGCHQIDARGGFVTGAKVPPLQTVAPTQIAEAVRIGPYEMPSFPESQISNSQLNSLIAYVISMRHPPNRGGWGIGNIGPIPEGLVVWWIAAPLILLSCLVLARRFKRS